LGPYRISVKLQILLPSKALENGTAEGGDQTNISDVPVAFLEDA
jgi:hypothetical protein